jgi:hypothetical protein
VDAEVGISHLAGQDERHRTRKKPNEHQAAAEGLEDSCGPSERCQIEWRRGVVERKTEELLRPVSDEQERYNDSQNAQQIRRP